VPPLNRPRLPNLPSLPRPSLPALPEAPLRVPSPLNSLRARLVIAFVAVVAIALALVLAAMPRLLDGYFIQQAREDLLTRTGVMRSLVANSLLQSQTAGVEAPRPILQPTTPLTSSQAVIEALGTPDQGFVRQAAEEIAQANVEVTIAADPAHPGDIAYRLVVALPDSTGAPGQQREPLSQELSFEIRDLFWSQTGTGVPSRLVTVRLSQPFTYRAQTLETIAGVMTVAAAIALLVAIVTSIILAERITNPIRRLTRASRELSEGHLDVRVPPPAGSPEMSELTAAFNAMADRLQQSIEFISRDRDRGRDFLADVSHELRTPIAALRTFNELLVEGAVRDPGTRREFLDQSRQQIERLDWLATNLLELSKLDSGLVLLDLRPDDLRAVVESAVEQARPSAERKQLELAVNVPAEPLRQRHDPQRLGQVLGNLIGNAVKFTPSGGRVEVGLRPTDDGAELIVRDNGAGIDPAELPHVFERFYRGAQTHESRAAGSGLGLSIVRSIVEMHNGRVAISSTPGQGTQVSVSLPREVSVSSPAAVRA
jgi:signal transduction histidine kinase